MAFDKKTGWAEGSSHFFSLKNQRPKNYSGYPFEIIE